MTLRRILAIILGILFLLAVARLISLENAGPAHADMSLPGGEPAELYLPGSGDPYMRLFPPAERPPCVVLGHGFLADRQFMSVLARRIAENGYAVLAIDFHGHGQNRNPLTHDELNPRGDLAADVSEAVQFLRGYNMVDGSRIVVVGHSMGADAVLDYATSDPALKGAVMISGGFGLRGPNRPNNALFIFAEHDLDFIQEDSQQLAAHLAGLKQVDLGKVYGDLGAGNAVEAVRVPGVDHIQIVYSAEAAETIVKWLDSVTGMNRNQPVISADPRMAASLVAFLLFLVLLVPIGRVSASIAGTRDAVDGSGWLGLLILAAALLAAMPLTSLNPAVFVSLVVGDVQVSWLLVAGIIMIAGLVFSGRIEWDRFGNIAGPLFAAAILFVTVYACQVAMSPVFHVLTFTPERAAAWALIALLQLPFWAAFEFLIRRGGVLMSTVKASLGRVLIIVLMILGMSAGVLPQVLGLVLPIVVIIFVMIEIFAASAYSASRNVMFIALAESAWFAWTIAATNPVTFKF
jgi:dienelactone hydrolase